MFGVYVESFTSSVGYGAESSTMQMTLVEDPNNFSQRKDSQGNLIYLDSAGNPTLAPQTCNTAIPQVCTDNPPAMGSVPMAIKHSLDGGATFIDGFPEVGTVCQFAFEGFEFVGIFQRYNYSESTGGRKYDVTFESPSKILDGVQVILSSFEGTAFTGNYRFYPSEDINFTSQLNNVYNPFGIKENYAWGGTFGYSDYNSVGFPVTDDLNRTGLAAKGLLTLIEEISQSKYTYDNPNGASLDTSVNSDGEELIGGPICYGDSKFTIDFGNLKTLVPDFFRLKGPTKSINSILNECCELIVHDYVTIINPVYTQVSTGHSTGTITSFAPGVPQGQYKNVIRNGVVPIQYDVDGNVTGPVISFKYLDKSVQPVPGTVANLVAAARLNDTLISANNGQEYADVVTQKMMIGDDATRVWEAGMEYLIPVYGKDANGEWLLGAGFADTDYAPVALPDGGVYYAFIQELKTALSGFEQWQVYHQLGGLYGYSNVGNPLYSSIAMGTTAAFTGYLQNTMPGGAFISGFSGDYHKKLIQQELSGNIYGNYERDEGGKAKQMFDAVLNTATNYYGKTYFVLLPVEPGGYDNNIRYKNAFETEAAWEISDSGWDPNFRIKDITAYTDEGSLKAHAGYYPSMESAQKDFSYIEKTVPYTLPGSTTLVGTEIEVDKDIYWMKNPYHQNNDNPYDDVSAMVHITCPQVFEFDPQATQKAYVDSVFNGQLAAMFKIPRGTPGFRGVTTFKDAEGRDIDDPSKPEPEPEPEGAAALGMQEDEGADDRPKDMADSGKDYEPNDGTTEQVESPDEPGGGTELTGHSNYGTFENEMMHMKYLPKPVRPFKVSIPQKSTRYSWGPWYKFSTKIGKAEVEKKSELKPETFGSEALMDEAAFALAYAGTADLYASESGSVDLAEFPQYNIADRFNTNGPYITKMDVSVGAGGITTKYQFSTWTRNFGKIAKYNIDRIAKANKDRIKAQKKGTVTQFKTNQKSPIAALQEHANALNPIDTNFLSGLQVPATASASAAANSHGASVWSASMKNAASLQFSYGRNVEFHDREEASYNFSFGCTSEQLFSPVGIRKNPRMGKDKKGRPDILPYVWDPTRGKNIDIENNGQRTDTDTKGGVTGGQANHFYNQHISPTSRDLDPYALSRNTTGMPARMKAFVKLDFGAVVMDDFAWLKENNMHLSHNGNTVPSDVDEVRTFGLRGPLLLSGWGYDVMGHPVPGKKDGNFEPVNPAENRASWKTGPVDLKWDDERQVWAGGLQFVEGILETKIEPADDAIDDPDTTGTMKVYRRTNQGAKMEWTDKDEHGEYGIITLTNRDPSLSVDPDATDDYDIYVMAVRINQEWRVVYISCDNFEAPEA
jgi:hypothetical protein